MSGSREAGFQTDLRGELDPMEQAIMAAVQEAVHGVTVPGLVRSIGTAQGFSRQEIRHAIRCLVDTGYLTYGAVNGQIYLTTSLQRTDLVSPHLLLAPSGVCTTPPPHVHVLKLDPAQSFGCGRHPTTRICLRGLDWLASQGAPPQSSPFLDIGTGTGVLAIAAARLGWPSGVAVDRDPCAVREAAHHIAVNALSHRITLETVDIFALPDAFELILANLRFPTLTDLVPKLARKQAPGKWLVLSGYQAAEVARLESVCSENGYRLCWSDCVTGWAGGVFQRDEMCFT